MHDDFIHLSFTTFKFLNAYESITNQSHRLIDNSKLFNIYIVNNPLSYGLGVVVHVKINTHMNDAQKLLLDAYIRFFLMST